MAWSLPFVGILLSIAIGPLVSARLWSRHYGKVAAAWSGLTLAAIAFAFGPVAALDAFGRSMLMDYMGFISLLFALYVAAGGIVVTGRVRLAFAAACPEADLFRGLANALIPQGP